MLFKSFHKDDDDDHNEDPNLMKYFASDTDEFLATLVALHLTPHPSPPSKWVGEWVVVSEKRSLELASLFIT